LHDKRPISDAFGVAFVLAPVRRAAAIAELTAVLTERAADRMSDPDMEALRLSIPAARSLPLLRKLALRERSRVTLDYLPHTRLDVEVLPCA
jgi:hypothetical protein